MQYTYIAGLDALHLRFERVVEDIKDKPYNVLDLENTNFDRDFLEFNVYVNDLENSLQVKPSLHMSICILNLIHQQYLTSWGRVYTTFIIALEAAGVKYEDTEGCPGFCFADFVLSCVALQLPAC